MRIVDFSWAVAISGDEQALKLCADQFVADEARITRHRLGSVPNEKWVLMSARLEPLTDELEVRTTAQTILTAINGILFTFDEGWRPIGPAGTVHRKAPNGEWGSTIFLPPVTFRDETALRAKLTVGEHTIPQTTVALGNILSSQGHLRNAIEHLSNQPGWYEIYKSIECIEDLYGGEAKLLEQPWAKSIEIKLAKQNANVHRHANAKPPKKKLSLRETRQISSALLRAAMKANGVV